eukprot:scaffold18306_cov30-Attheya_sp.AAC.1
MRTLSTFAIAALLLVDINAKQVTLTASNVDTATDIENAINEATNELRKNPRHGDIGWEGRTFPLHA